MATRTLSGPSRRTVEPASPGRPRANLLVVDRRCARVEGPVAVGQHHDLVVVVLAVPPLGLGVLVPLALDLALALLHAVANVATCRAMLAASVLHAVIAATSTTSEATGGKATGATDGPTSHEQAGRVTSLTYLGRARSATTAQPVRSRGPRGKPWGAGPELEESPQLCRRGPIGAEWSARTVRSGRRAWFVRAKVCPLAGHSTARPTGFEPVTFGSVVRCGFHGCWWALAFSLLVASFRLDLAGSTSGVCRVAGCHPLASVARAACADGVLRSVVRPLPRRRQARRVFVEAVAAPDRPRISSG